MDKKNSDPMALKTKNPSDLPSSFAVLIRPDGHIAWIKE
jgi:hypothetical protein